MRKIIAGILLAVFTTISPLSAFGQSVENLSVTATVLPTQNDFSVTVSTDASGALSENNQFTILVTYSVEQQSSFPFTITASWGEAAVGSTQIDILNYVVGSATNAYGDTAPQIDLLNRTITWSLSQSPSANQDHMVSFDLKVKPYIPTDALLTVRVDGTAEYADVENIDSTSVQIQTSPPGPTSTSGPLPTSAPTPVVTSIITPELLFESIKFISIGAEEATIQVETNLDTIKTVQYGLCSADKFDKEAITGYSRMKDIVTLENLERSTMYCFQVVASNTLLNLSITSDVFLFTTAAEESLIELGSYQLFWNNILLNSSLLNTAVIPQSQSTAVYLNLEPIQSIESIEIEFVNQQTLGLYSSGDYHIEKNRLIAIDVDLFAATLDTPRVAGAYYLRMFITTPSGATRVEDLPLDIQISEPMQVLEKGSQKPIEYAKVSLQRFFLQKEDILDHAFRAQQDPSSTDRIYYSDEHGNVIAAVPPGNYTFAVTAEGYKSQTLQDYPLGISTNSYPVIYLEKEDTLYGLFLRLNTSFFLFYGSTLGLMSDYFASYRLLELTWYLFLGVTLTLIISFASLFHINHHKKDQIINLLVFSLHGSFVIGFISLILFIQNLGVGNVVWSLILYCSLLLFYVLLRYRLSHERSGDETLP